MKSERRHELQHNALLEWLMQTNESVKPYMTAILLGIVLVLVGAVAFKWISSQSAANEAVAWDSVFQAMAQGNTAALDQTAEDFPKTNAAQWATVVAADLQLSAGCQDLFTTKATAGDQFMKAQAKYKDVLKESSEDALRERATYGLARTHEAMAGVRSSKEDLDEAKKQYAEVVKNWPDGAYAKEAKVRLDALNRNSTLEFYDALAAWQPRPAITSPKGMGDLNIPFDESGKGLDVGGKPKDHFGDILDKLDGATENPAGAKPVEKTGESTEIPAMPAATGDKPAEKDNKPAPAADKPAD